MLSASDSVRDHAEMFQPVSGLRGTRIKMHKDSGAEGHYGSTASFIEKDRDSLTLAMQSRVRRRDRGAYRCDVSADGLIRKPIRRHGSALGLTDLRDVAEFNFGADAHRASRDDMQHGLR